jgi:hypothetical protein
MVQEYNSKFTDSYLLFFKLVFYLIYLHNNPNFISVRLVHNPFYPFQVLINLFLDYETTSLSFTTKNFYQN